jgi:hypothetical protein
MTDVAPPLSRLYREARERFTGLVRAHPEAARLPVPATPGWTVHDAVAHMAGVVEDVVAGRVPARATPEWTAGHLQRGHGQPTTALLDEWERASSLVEDLLDQRPVWPLLLDVGAHEHDVRSALGEPAPREDEIVVHGTDWLLRHLHVPVPLVVRTERLEVRTGPDEGDPLVLTTTTWEAFRWRLGRRSAAQIAAMDWSGDPSAVLGALCIFGPAAQDVTE